MSLYLRPTPTAHARISQSKGLVEANISPYSFGCKQRWFLLRAHECTHMPDVNRGCRPLSLRSYACACARVRASVCLSVNASFEYRLHTYAMPAHISARSRMSQSCMQHLVSTRCTGYILVLSIDSPMLCKYTVCICVAARWCGRYCRLRYCTVSDWPRKRAVAEAVVVGSCLINFCEIILRFINRHQKNQLPHNDNERVPPVLESCRWSALNPQQIQWQIQSDGHYVRANTAGGE